jgi:hypothetical protein
LERQKKKRNKIILLEVFLVLILFAVSLFLRWPNIDRHLGSGHEWLTAHTLIQHRIWEEQGAIDNRFRFLFNYAREADKFINNASMSDFESDNFHDGNGNYYYPSYPSMAIALPYVLFQAFHISPDVRNIQIFNLILHLICALLLYFIVSLVYQSKARCNFAAVLAAAFYLLLPMHMWFSANTYFVEMFVQPAYIFLVFIALILKKQDKSWKRAKKTLFLFLLALASFTACSSEWLGLIAAFFLTFYFLIFIKRSAIYKYMAISIASGAVLAMSLYIWQYAGAIGLSNFLRYLFNKFIFRAGASESGLSQVDFSVIGMHYLYGFYGLFVIFLFVFFIAVFNRKRARQTHFFSKYGFVLSAFFVPAFIHQALFLNFTSVHHYAPLKISMFFILACCLLIGEMMDRKIFDDKFKLFFLYGLIILACYTSFHTYNNYYAQTIDLRDQNEYTFGTFIAETAKDDEVIFLTFQRPTSPYIIFYSGRNYVSAPDVESAKEWLQNSQNKASKGILFLDWQNNRFVRFDLEK